MSNPASRSTRALCSSGLAPDEVADVGVVDVEHDHLGRPPGLAARLDGPGRGVGPRMNDTGPEASPPWPSCSRDERMVDRLMPRPALEDHALLDIPVEDRRHGVGDRQDEAVVDADVVGEVLAAVGLDVEDGLHTAILDGDDLLLAERRAGLASPGRIQRRHFPDDRNPTLDRNADRSERMLICTSNRSERSGRGSALRRRRE